MIEKKTRKTSYVKGKTWNCKNYFFSYKPKWHIEVYVKLPRNSSPQSLREVQSLLKVLSCKLHNNRYMTASLQITNNEICAFIAALVFKLLSRKILFKNRKDNRNC